MDVCVACQSKDAKIDPVSELCLSCQEELFPDHATNGVPADHVVRQPATIILTTEATSNLAVRKRLGIVSAECVIGQHIFKDVAASLRDLFGGRSKVMQNGLREAKSIVLEELSDEAA